MFESKLLNFLIRRCYTLRRRTNRQFSLIPIDVCGKCLNKYLLFAWTRWSLSSTHHEMTINLYDETTSRSAPDSNGIQNNRKIEREGKRELEINLNHFYWARHKIPTANQRCWFSEMLTLCVNGLTIASDLY